MPFCKTSIQALSFVTLTTRIQMWAIFFMFRMLKWNKQRECAGILWILPDLCSCWSHELILEHIWKCERLSNHSILVPQRKCLSGHEHVWTPCFLWFNDKIPNRLHMGTFEHHTYSIFTHRTLWGNPAVTEIKAPTVSQKNRCWEKRRDTTADLKRFKDKDVLKERESLKRL